MIKLHFMMQSVIFLWLTSKDLGHNPEMDSTEFFKNDSI